MPPARGGTGKISKMLFVVNNVADNVVFYAILLNINGEPVAITVSLLIVIVLSDRGGARIPDCGLTCVSVVFGFPAKDEV